ncbi:matrixin family metalloprotease [Chitinophaga filiformis]|uniref:matrixin family metalloprotease n=1 Tax=Chitinophaga filiformis TaxID=104663 RepID=UPI001F1FF98A|nr:matrixin family metalloprotease [Chitinophaga filiformis]MCF6402919.1 matrixin family metalloprotease [Chitinophaga filiformis]
MKKVLLFALLLLSGKMYAQIKYDNGGISLTNPQIGEYTIQGNSWDHRIITYFFQNGTDDIAGDQERQAVRDAFALWAAQTNLAFVESCAANADIVISWVTGDHGDGYPFNDGAGGVLAHTFYPPPSGPNGLPGDMHFDDAETWTLSTRSGSSQPIDLVSVAAHEIGHALGLAHSTVEGALMYPYYNGSHRYLAQDDINGIRAIYGAPTGTLLRIDGNNNVCGPTVYSLPNAHGALDITWTVSSGVVTLAPAGNQVTLTRTASMANATITLNAFICNGTALLASRTINVGPDRPVVSAEYDPLHNRIMASATSNGPGVTSYEFHLDGHVVTTNTSGGARLNITNSFCNHEVAVRVNTAACGTSDFGYAFVNSCTELAADNFNVYPNPARGSIAISTGASQTGKTAKLASTAGDIREVRIIGQKGDVVKIQRFGAGTRQTTVDLSGIIPGTYIVRIFDGKQWVAKRLVVVE